MVNITLIDDDPDDIALVISILKQIGPTNVKSFTDAEEAINSLLIEASRPDYVIMDFRMPKIDGLELLRKIRRAECCKHSQIVIFSSMISRIDMTRCKDAGADQIMIKPFTFEEYKIAIKAMMDSGINIGSELV